MTKKVIFIMFLSMFLICTIGEPVIAATGSITNIDEFDSLEGDGKYLGSQYRNNYHLDIEETGILDAIYKTINEFANTFFKIIHFIGYATATIFYHAISFDINAQFAPFINAIQSSLHNSIFKTLFILAFSLSLISVLKKYVKRDLTGILIDMGKVLFIYVLSILVVAESATILSVATNITKEISISILMGVNNKGTVTTKSYAADASGLIWTTIVHQPWVSLEFNDSNAITTTDIETILGNGRSSTERKDFIKDFISINKNNPSNKEVFDKTQGSTRLGMIIVYIIPCLIKCAIFIGVALLQMVAQILAIFYILLAPVILILAMLPSFGGIDLISTWVKKILETQVSIFIIMFVMGLIIKISDILNDLSTTTWGWFLVLIIETVIMVVIFMNRNKMLSFVEKTSDSMRNPMRLQNKLKNSTGTIQLYNTGVQGIKDGIEKLENITYKDSNDNRRESKKQEQEYIKSENISEDENKNVKVAAPTRPYSTTETKESNIETGKTNNENEDKEYIEEENEKKVKRPISMDVEDEDNQPKEENDSQEPVIINNEMDRERPISVEKENNNSMVNTAVNNKPIEDIPVRIIENMANQQETANLSNVQEITEQKPINLEKEEEESKEIIKNKTSSRTETGTVQKEVRPISMMVENVENMESQSGTKPASSINIQEAEEPIYNRPVSVVVESNETNTEENRDSSIEPPHKNEPIQERPVSVVTENEQTKLETKIEPLEESQARDESKQERPVSVAIENEQIQLETKTESLEEIQARDESRQERPVSVVVESKEHQIETRIDSSVEMIPKDELKQNKQVSNKSNNEAENKKKDNKSSNNVQIKSEQVEETEDGFTINNTTKKDEIINERPKSNVIHQNNDEATNSNQTVNKKNQPVSAMGQNKELKQEKLVSVIGQNLDKEDLPIQENNEIPKKRMKITDYASNVNNPQP